MEMAMLNFNAITECSSCGELLFVRKKGREALEELIEKYDAHLKANPKCAADHNWQERSKQ